MTYLSTLLAMPSNEASASCRAEPRRDSIVDRVLKPVRRWMLRRNTISELSALSEAQLRDIGVERADFDDLVERRLDELRKF